MSTKLKSLAKEANGTETLLKTNYSREGIQIGSMTINSNFLFKLRIITINITCIKSNRLATNKIALSTLRWVERATIPRTFLGLKNTPKTF